MNRADIEERKKILSDAFLFRHATKTFDGDRIIPDSDFAFILEAGRLSPSSFGLEPWNIIVVQEPGLRAQLREVSWGAQGQLPSASHFVVFSAYKGSFLKPEGDYLKHMIQDVRGTPERLEEVREKFADFTQHDFDLHNDRLLSEWAARQAYIAIGTMMSAAAFIGVDSCPIEGFNQAEVDKLLTNKKLIDAPTQTAICMVAFGYREREQKVKTRRPLEEVVTWS